MADDNEKKKMGFNATWSMAVGGMVGGGIFSVLGVVIATAGSWAWLSFVVGGLIAASAASSYSLLAEKFGEGGGAFTFLREVKHKDFAGSVSWVLILGYTLTLAVYAFTFGHYLAHVVELGAWFPRVAGVTLIMTLVAVNLRGVGSAAIVEVIAVWGKLIVLCGLGILGLAHWAPEQIAASGGDQGIGDAVVGAAAVFMAYEGFQLLAYDYDDVRDPEKTVPLAMLTAVASVMVVYLIVTIGSVMLIGGSAIVENKEVALVKAGEAVLGTPGVWVVTVAALFSTASAINATLFAVGRLARVVAHDGELPKFFEHNNAKGIPNRSIIVLGVAASVLAALGSLEMLVEAASLGFLLTFSVVNALAFIEVNRRRWASMAGALSGMAAAVVLVFRQLTDRPLAAVAFVGMVLLATAGRHWVLKRTGEAGTT